MKKFRMTSLLLVVLILLTGQSLFAQVSIGIRIGPPPPPVVVRVLPARPAPEFVWVDGYWYPVGNHWKWHKGYWTQAPYVGARWLAPHYEGGLFFAGYWEGDRGRFEHDHRWDHDRARDYRGHDRDHDHDHDHDHDRH
jgi:hypothetical protein